MAEEASRSAMSLAPDVEASYAAIIDGILTAADLDTISAKAIRKRLQAAVNYDVTPQKEAITELIMERFDKFNTKRNEECSAPRHKVNGTDVEVKKEFKRSGSSSPSTEASTKRQHDSDDMSDSVNDQTPRKRVKHYSRDNDAMLAARLQAEELGRARPTRAGTTRKQRAISKKTATKKKGKSAAKIEANDDSEDEDADGADQPANRSGPFHKPMVLSLPLSNLLGGETVLSRPQTVKKIWDYVKGKDLQNPNDRRQIRCDDALRAVFKTDSVHMFTMNKILSDHLHPADE